MQFGALLDSAVLVENHAGFSVVVVPGDKPETPRRVAIDASMVGLADEAEVTLVPPVNGGFWRLVAGTAVAGRAAARAALQPLPRKPAAPAAPVSMV